MKHKILYLSVIIFVILFDFVLLWRFSGNLLYSIGKNQCKERDGVWIQVGQSYCNFTYRDGGKECTSSEECEANCKFRGQNQPATCAYDTEDDWNPSIENPDSQVVP
ncbi:MAG: hypothetical protein A3B74_03360 [Candidatus Kerfeldbacteria bacterium RIFCSPHIGHO2_02_FULL_42_14]|uniref:Uncharacterized protein n=1 Tax=Candidatus Kerfeldbacteria bacterium RIFCSPHIGHO2_02_FULL_42_14 TaxID=1798540 RepID=A0A1G2AQH1_9BACT|nr:MAG: hypothetical protein A3B74_03360 [Candidatus Kerfeldbacteria bacterium RIFCSPHIGHO2_02_FULL_42_14]OGY80944.1 MAG: hypothetical protein A3E60_03270 [Candidatus Kerfeldbacteria bacterium RIFCSPHIGHO2_12_FULL_42_13]OGY84178.1 MAG: hypothetical protein A3I91_01675 [Candidatus Kerfeldbacteria bacterium RIFCSPLOWO2_02_FULL_42_19]OGY87309.1 MAG: hypothetical protein A3G01_03150 [Candidatus Kerfeldbacteria bacterium RIFCSPLOWO2_12_FULL_43_9]